MTTKEVTTLMKILTLTMVMTTTTTSKLTRAARKKILTRRLTTILILTGTTTRAKTMKTTPTMTIQTLRAKWISLKVSPLTLAYHQAGWHGNPLLQ